MKILPPSIKTDYGFYNNYIRKATENDLIAALNDTLDQAKSLAGTFSDEQLNFRYSEGKWSIKELFVHLVDSERTFCYCIMRISRGDESILPAINVHDFIINSQASERTIASILKELELLRRATILMFEEMNEPMLEKTAMVRDAVISVRALGFAMAGHIIHHSDIIKEKYLPEINQQVVL